MPQGPYCDSGETRGRADSGPSFCSFLWLHPQTRIPSDFSSPRSWGGDGQVAGHTLAFVCIAGCSSAPTTSGCHFLFLIIRIPGEELSCRRLQGIFPPGLKSGPRKCGHAEGILSTIQMCFLFSLGTRKGCLYPESQKKVLNFIMVKKTHEERS